MLVASNFVGVILLAAGAGPAHDGPTVLPQTPGGHRLAYRSPVDDSRQHYTLYLPKGYRPDGRRYPLVFFGTGYGGKARLPGRRDWADRHAWIFAGFDGRRIQHYYGIGETDFDQVLHRELARHYPIDLRRVYFIGSSMGASGAFGLGFRHPDWFASVAGSGGFVDYNEFYPRWTAKPIAPGRWPERFSGPMWQRVLLTAWSPVDTAESGAALVPYIAAGELDGVNRTFASRRLAERLTKIGAAHVYVEAKGVGHGGGFDVRAMLEHFRLQGRPVDPHAPEVRLATNRLEFGRNRWVRLTSLFSRNKVSTVHAWASRGLVELKTSGPLRGLELKLVDAPTSGRRRTPPAKCVVRVDGTNAFECSYGRRPKTVHLRRSGPAATDWRVADEAEPGRKTAGLEGPINHVFTTPFVIVYGTSGTAKQTAVDRAEADGLAAYYNKMHYAAVKPIADRDVTDETAKAKSLVLVGTEVSNRWLQRLAEHRNRGGAWPLTLTDAVIAIRGIQRRFSPADHGVLLVHPSPFAPGRYVVASHGTGDGGIHGLGCFSLFKLPDYVVFSRKTTDFVLAGLFDETWRVGERTKDEG